AVRESLYPGGRKIDKRAHRFHFSLGKGRRIDLIDLSPLQIQKYQLLSSFRFFCPDTPENILGLRLGFPWLLFFPSKFRLRLGSLLSSRLFLLGDPLYDPVQSFRD